MDTEITKPVLEEDDLERLLLIRTFEQSLLSLFTEGRLTGTTHTCLGQEYIPVALRPLLEPEDFIFSNHRGHGHYLARFEDPEGLLAEIMGREGAVCGGVGGSQHIYRSGYLSTGIQGESMPIAAGVALSLKRRVEGGLAVAYIGDGTWGQGAVYETLNIAQLWRLPLQVIVENNGIAQSTPAKLHMAGTIADRARAFGIGYQCVRTVDIAEIRRALAEPIAEARRAPQPLIVEFETRRLGPHSKGDDTRDAAEIEAFHAGDWYPYYRQRLPEPFARIEVAVRERLERLVAEIGARPAVGSEVRS